jgi:hypothetical protein
MILALSIFLIDHFGYTEPPKKKKGCLQVCSKLVSSSTEKIKTEIPDSCR